MKFGAGSHCFAYNICLLSIYILINVYLDESFKLINYLTNFHQVCTHFFETVNVLSFFFQLLYVAKSWLTLEFHSGSQKLNIFFFIYNMVVNSFFFLRYTKTKIHHFMFVHFSWAKSKYTICFSCIFVVLTSINIILLNYLMHKLPVCCRLKSPKESKENKSKVLTVLFIWLIRNICICLLLIVRLKSVVISVEKMNLLTCLNNLF